MIGTFRRSVGKRYLSGSVRRGGSTSTLLTHRSSPDVISRSLVNIQSLHQLPKQSSSQPLSLSRRWSSTEKHDRMPLRVEDLPDGSFHKEKAMKAEQLHRELKAMMERQDERLRVEQSRGLFTRIGDFVKHSRSQIINILAAFACVVLAYQIAVIRRYGRLLEQKVKETEKELSDKQALLRSLAGEDFLSRVADQCAAQLASSSSSAWFGSTNKEKTAAILLPILHKEMGAIIGDSVLTEEEKKEKVVKELMERASTSAASAGVHEDLQVEVTSEGESGTKVVKKRVFSI